MPAEGCKGDLEEQLAYEMFIDDLKEIRNFVASALNSTLTGQIKAERKFAKEREFYNEQNEILKKQNADLKARIDKLTSDLKQE